MTDDDEPIRDRVVPVGMPTINRLVGVYNAQSTFVGEVSYWVGARLGRAHCALCDITHGSVRERRDWQACRAGLPVPFATFHRNDQPDAVRAALGDAAPAVVADTTAGIVPLLDATALDACAASPDALVAAIESAVAARGLGWLNPLSERGPEGA